MNDLIKAFEASGGEALMAWCVENGYINEDIGEHATKLIEHNLIMRLFIDAGIQVVPVIPKNASAPVKEEENAIDEVLNNG